MNNCRCQCETFREHALSVSVSAVATPSRRPEAKKNTDVEARWTKENEAYIRLARSGHTLPHLNGADIIEKNARTAVELKHGRLYGDKAELMQRAADGDFNA